MEVLEGGGQGEVEREALQARSSPAPLTSHPSPVSLSSNPEGDDGWGQGRNLELGAREGKAAWQHHRATHLRSPQRVRSQLVGIGWGAGPAGGSGGAQAPPPPPRPVGSGAVKVVVPALVSTAARRDDVMQLEARPLPALGLRHVRKRRHVTRRYPGCRLWPT